MCLGGGGRFCPDSELFWQNSRAGDHSDRAAFPGWSSCGGAVETLGSCFLYFRREREESSSVHTPVETKARVAMCMSDECEGMSCGEARMQNS